jgi:hypothetical protein
VFSKLKKQPTKWEKNLCQLYIKQGTGNQNIKGAQKVNSPKVNDPIKKCANDLIRAFLKEESKWLKNS